MHKAGRILMAMLMLLAMAPAAFAGLAQVGPIDPNTQVAGNPDTGFPAFYTDANGVTLGLWPITGDGVNAPTQIYAPPDPANPYSVQLGFDQEAFYFFARCIFNTKNGRATATFGLEAAFINGPTTPGDEIVFARVRLRAPIRDVGIYKFYHPWGVETINVTAADVASKRVDFTKDIGLSRRVFGDALNGPIGPFLVQLSPPPPAGWIGDGVSVATVTGSPIDYNKVTLEGPVGVDLDGRKNNFVTSNQFTVSGRIATQKPAFLNVDRATCYNDPISGAEFIDVFATADPGDTVTVSGDPITGEPFGLDPATGQPLQLPLTTDILGLSGKFYGHLPNPSAIVNTSPFPIYVTSSGGTLTSTTKQATVVDLVNILQADYSVGLQKLIIRASSTDAPTPTLTVQGFNQNLPDPTGAIALEISGITVPPPSVTVTSTMGGKDTTPVSIVP